MNVTDVKVKCTEAPPATTESSNENPQPLGEEMLEPVAATAKFPD